MRETGMEYFATNLRLERVLPGSARDVPTCCSTSGLRLSLFGLRLSSETLLGRCSATFAEDWIRDALQLRPNPTHVDWSPAFWVDKLHKEVNSVSEVFSDIIDLFPDLVVRHTSFPYLILDPISFSQDVAGYAICALSGLLLQQALPDKYMYWADLLPEAEADIFDVSIFVASVGEALISIKIMLGSQLTKVKSALQEAVMQAAEAQEAAPKRLKEQWAEVNSPDKMSLWLTSKLNSKPPVFDPTIDFADESSAQKLIPAAEAAGKARKAFEAFRKEKDLKSKRAQQLALEALEADKCANQLAMEVKISIDSQTTEAQCIAKPAKKFQEALIQALRKKALSIPKGALSAGVEGDIPLEDLNDAVGRMNKFETTAHRNPLAEVQKALKETEKAEKRRSALMPLSVGKKNLWCKTIDAVKKARACERAFFNSPVELQEALASGKDGDLPRAFRRIGTSSKEFLKQMEDASGFKEKLQKTDPDAWNELKKKHNTKIEIAGRELTPGDVQELTGSASPNVQEVLKLAEQAQELEDLTFDPKESMLFPAWDPDKELFMDYLNTKAGSGKHRWFHSKRGAAILQFITAQAAPVLQAEAAARARWKEAVTAFKTAPELDTFKSMMHQVREMAAIEKRIRSFQAQARSDETEEWHRDIDIWRANAEDPTMVQFGRAGKPDIKLPVSDLEALFRKRVPQRPIPEFSQWSPGRRTFVEETLDKLMHPEPKLAKRTAQAYPAMDEGRLIQELVKLPPEAPNIIENIVKLTKRSAESWQEFQRLVLSERVAVSDETLSLVDLQRQVLKSSHLQVCLDAEKGITALFKEIRNNQVVDEEYGNSLLPRKMTEAAARDLINELKDCDSEVDPLSEVLGRMECEWPAAYQIPESAAKRLTAHAMNSERGSPTLEQMVLIRRIARAKMKEIQASGDVNGRTDLLTKKASKFGLPCDRLLRFDHEAVVKNFYDDYYSADAWYEPKSTKRRQQQYWRQQLRSFLQPQLEFKALAQIGSKDAAFTKLSRTALIDPKWFLREFFP